MAKSPRESQSPSPDPADLEAAQQRMSFGEHLEELRKRIMRALGGSMLGVGLCLYFVKDIIDVVVRPYRLACEAHGLPALLGTLKPQEAFLTSITLAFQAGLIVSSPWIIYQLWQFIAAGLYPKERKIVYRFTLPSAMLFLTGVAFFYFIVLPMTLNFFIGFAANTAGAPPRANWLERIILGTGPAATMPATMPATAPAGPATSSTATSATTPAEGVPISLPMLNDDPPAPPPGPGLLYYNTRERSIKMRTHERTIVILVAQENSLFINNWRYDDYLGFVTFTALIFGLAFELPMVILILARTDLVRTQTFRNIRKYAYFGILISAAIAAPSGDLMTLAFLTFPLIGLYELGILAAAFSVGRQEARD